MITLNLIVGIYVILSAAILYFRIQWHTDDYDLDLPDFVGIVVTSLIPVISLVIFAVAMNERYSRYWSDIIVFSKKSRRQFESQNMLAKLIHPTKFEIVTIPAMMSEPVRYMIRRTKKWFRLFPAARYLNLFGGSDPWCRWGGEDFTDRCTTKDIDRITKVYVSLAGVDNIVVDLGGGRFDVGDIAHMLKMAQLDEGMRDLLSQAKTYWLLKYKEFQ